MVKKNNKEWNKRVSGALSVIEKAAKKQKYDCSHTVDGKKLKKNLKVFVLDDPTIQWSISEIEKEITIKKDIITLEISGKEPIKKHPTKLFVDQEKAINACVKDIQKSELAILRDMKENLNRLDASNRIGQLVKLNIKLYKRKNN